MSPPEKVHAKLYKEAEQFMETFSCNLYTLATAQCNPTYQ